MLAQQTNRTLDNSLTQGKNLPDKIARFDNTPSVGVIASQQELYNAKQQGSITNMLAVQSKLDGMTGSVTLNPVRPENCVLIPGHNPPFIQNSSSISISEVYSANRVRALAIATKQIPGDNEGEIWVAIARGEPSESTDTLLVFRSTDNGLTWIFSGGTFYTGSTFNEDELDMEIIESNTADRYIWIVFGRSQGLQKKLGVLVIKANSTMDSFDLGFPEHANLKYYRPRITSDNAAYYTNAWIYIVCARDSIMPGTGYDILADERAALVLNPYNVFPPITLKPTPVGYTTYLTPTPSFKNYVDIAYYHNGGDSIIVTESNLPDTAKIYTYRTSITSFTGSALFGPGSIIGESKWKTHARVATNGGYKEIMVVCDQKTQIAGGNWDIPFFYSTNGANGPWASGYIDSRPHASIYPDLAGRRNVSGKYYVSYLNIQGGPFDSVTICTATNGIWGSIVEPVNHLGSAHRQPPKPGIRFVNNDSCITIWSSYSSTAFGLDVFASNGCMLPVVTGENGNNKVPDYYLLKQNYPNPFNPLTTIGFDIPQAGLVNLQIFNVLGEYVTELFNEYLTAGTHEVEWNAASFSSGLYFYKITVNRFTEIKKMVLIK